MALRIDIINRALQRIGQPAMQTEQSPGADGRLGVYESVTESLLSSYPWVFAKKLRQLTQLLTPPVAFWSYAYQLPDDIIGTPRAVWDNNVQAVSAVTSGDTGRTAFTDYEYVGNTLVTNAAQVWMLYTFKAPPLLWPGQWREMAVLAIAAEFALREREDQALRQRLRADVYGTPGDEGMGGMMALAMTLDSQSQPSQRLSQGVHPLLDVRR